jgi:hypothetical protein
MTIFELKWYLSRSCSKNIQRLYKSLTYCFSNIDLLEALYTDIADKTTKDPILIYAVIATGLILVIPTISGIALAAGGGGIRRHLKCTDITCIIVGGSRLETSYSPNKSINFKP